jgi:two-component system OmpR family sensor kinase
MGRCRKDRGSRWRRPKRLQHRIFMWFGASIVVTAIIVAGVFRLLGSEAHWQKERQGVERFLGGRLAEVWDRPEARDAFVRDLHGELHMDATVRDADGAVLHAVGGACEQPWARIPVVRGDLPLGSVDICGGARPPPLWRVFLVIFTAMAVLWGAAGIIARRMLRPLRHLEHLAYRIGEGDFEARSRLDPKQHFELGVLGQIMDRMAARIGKQIADQRELLAAVSHELRTPLGHLRVLIELGRDGHERYEDMEREIVEIDELVGQLLASSRVEFERLEGKSVDPVALAERALQRQGLAPGLLSVPGRMPMVDADPTLLARALANLLRNAEAHGQGTTRLGVTPLDGGVRFEVDDAGPGFAPEERERAFQAFFRGERRSGSSLGLGLALVRRIAEAHGGRAFAEDAPGGGARVVLEVRSLDEGADPLALDADPLALEES